MNISIATLNDSDLNVFLQGIPEKIIREFFAKSSRYSKNIRGFRIQSVPQYMLIKAARKLIKIDKDYIFIKKCDLLVQDCQKNIEDLKKSSIDQGLDESVAYELALEKVTKPEFRKVFIKLAGVDEMLVAKGKEKAEIINLIKYEIESHNSHDNQSDKKKFNDLQESLDDLKKEIQSLDEQIKLLSIEQERLEKNTSETQIATNESIKQFNSLKTSIDPLLSKADDTRKLTGLAKETFSNINKRLDCLSEDVKIIKTYKIEIKEPMVPECNCLSIEKHTCTVFDSDTGEYLDQDISDVICKTIQDDQLNIFRGFITECLFSNKILIASKENAIHLADILSGIMTGQNYYRFIADNDLTNHALIDEINKKIMKEENNVFLIDGALGKFDLDIAVSFIKSLPFTDKFIFSISSDSFIKFLPQEMLKDFIFFSARLSKAPYDYVYKTIIGNKNYNESQQLYEFLVKAGLEFAYSKVVCPDITGLLSYSLIPFKRLHDGVSNEDLLKLIDDPSLRTKCKDILHE